MTWTRLAIALSLSAAGLVGAIVAFAPLQPGQAGGFEATGFAFVVAPPGVTDVAWNLATKDSSRVRSVTFKFVRDLTPPSLVCVQVSDSVSNILANGCGPTGSLMAGDPVTVHFDNDPGLTASAALITGVSITLIKVIGPVAVVVTDGVQVTHVAWDLLETDTTLVDQVTVQLHSDPPGLFKVTLQLKDAGDNVLQESEEFGDQKIPGIIVWTLDPAEPRFAAAIVRFEIEAESAD